MDPITHGLIGMAVSAASQNTFTVLNPVTVAAVTGSVMPDGDIILRLLGNSVYLKHHRGISHSLVGIMIEACAAGMLLKILYRSFPLMLLILWAFIGALTHIISDTLNSYGAKVLWPISNKKCSLSMLTITDPLVIALSFASIISSHNRWGYNKYIISIFLMYIISKIFMHMYGKLLLRKEFRNIYNIEKIHLLPSMIAGHKFQYIVVCSLSKIVGEIDFLFNKVRIFNIFKRIDMDTREYVLQSRTARYFKDFTPIYHVNMVKIKDGYRAILTDLRYILRGKFLHHATIIYDEKMDIINEKFHPYNINKSIDV